MDSTDNSGTKRPTTGSSDGHAARRAEPRASMNSGPAAAPFTWAPGGEIAVNGKLRRFKPRRVGLLGQLRLGGAGAPGRSPTFRASGTPRSSITGWRGSVVG